MSRVVALLFVLAAVSLVACSDDDYGRSTLGDGGTDGGDASAVTDLATAD